MPVRDELPIRAVGGRKLTAKVICSHLIAAIPHPDRIALVAVWLIVGLTIANAVLYFPSLGETIAMLEPF
jgi:hypothetical protein